MHLASALWDECLCFSAIFVYLNLFIFRSVFSRVSVLVVFVHFLWWCLEHLIVAGLWTLLSIVLCVWLRDIWYIWYTSFLLHLYFGIKGTDERKDLLWWFCFTWSFLLLVLLFLSRFWCVQVHCRCHDVSLLQKVSILHCRKNVCWCNLFVFLSASFPGLVLHATQIYLLHWSTILSERVAGQWPQYGRLPSKGQKSVNFLWTDTIALSAYIYPTKGDKLSSIV